jgi:hypothetical protein
MLRHSFELLLLCPLTACASTSDMVSRPVAEDLDLFTYHVEVPAGASETVLQVATSEPFPSVLSIHGLVGNAPFDLPLRAGEASYEVPFDNGQVALVFRSISRVAFETWEVRASTRKPLELDLRLGFPKGSTDVAALERALAECTSATRDGRPVEAVTTRLVRVR